MGEILTEAIFSMDMFLCNINVYGLVQFPCKILNCLSCDFVLEAFVLKFICFG